MSDERDRTDTESPTILSNPSTGGGRRIVSNPDDRTIAAHITGGSPSTLSSSVGLTTPKPGEAHVVRQFGDYELTSEIARGGMGIVYKARQVSLNRPVALKMILSGQFASAADLDRFHVEAEAAASLDHPNIVPIYEVGQHEGHHFFSMKLVEGGSLAREMPGLRTRPRDGVALVVKICRAIHYAHQHGILHRDIKPANILIDRSGEPHVTDFGLAKRAEGDSQLTQTGTIVGTPSYMAPEQASASATPVTTSVDVYSLGAMLYELLTGRPPFRAESPLDTLMLVLHKEPDKPRSINVHADRDLETIALKTLEKEPARRYGSAEALAEDLDRWLANEPILARPIGTTERMVKWAKRRPAIAALAAGIAVMALLGVAGIAWQWRQAEQQRQRAEDATLDASNKADAAVKAEQATAQALISLAAEAKAREEALKQTEQQKTIAQRALADEEVTLYLSNLYTASLELQANNISHIDQLLAASPASQRNWEWHYVSRVAHMEDRVIPLGSAIGNIGFGQDGQELVVAQTNDSVTTLDARTFRQVRSTKLDGVDGQLGLLNLSRDGRILLSQVSARDGTLTRPLKAWDTSSGRNVFTLAPLEGQLSAVSAYAVSPRLDRLVASCPMGRGSPSYRLRVWDVNTWTEQAPLTELPAAATAMAISPDGGRLAVANNGEFYIRVLDMKTGTTLTKISRPDLVEALLFSPDGARLLALIRGKGVHVWAADDGKDVWTWAYDRDVARPTFSPDGRRLAVGLADRSLRVLDADNGRELTRLAGQSSAITGLRFTQDGAHLLSAGSDGTLRVWTPFVSGLTTQVLGEGRTDPVYSVTASGPSILALTSVGLRGWHATTGRDVLAITSKPSPGPYAALMRASADGSRALVSPALVFVDSGGGHVTGRIDVKAIDAENGREVALLQQPGPTGAGFASLSAASAAGATMFDTSEMRDLAVSRDGRRAALAVLRASIPLGRGGAQGKPDSLRSEVHIFDIATGRPSAHVSLPDALVFFARFTPDGTQFASLVLPLATRDRARIDIYDTATARLLRTWGESLDAFAGGFGFEFSTDGRRLATSAAANGVSIWDVATGSKRASLPEHNHTIDSLAFSPDGTRIALVMSDGTVEVWDAIRGSLLMTLPEGGAAFSSRDLLVAGRAGGNKTQAIAFSPDGHQIVLTVMQPDLKGMRIQFKTWDGSPRGNGK